MIKRISRRTKHRHTPRHLMTGAMDRFMRLQYAVVEVRSRQQGLTHAMERAGAAFKEFGYTIHSIRRARP